jgi:acyl-CoA thioesterase
MERWMTEYFERDRLAKGLDFLILDASEGYAKVSVDICDKHLNGADMVHGGTIFALADFALAIASNFKGIISVSTNASIVYMKAAQGSKLIAEAKCIKETRKLGFYTIDISDGDDMVSRMEATVYITGKENPMMRKYMDRSNGGGAD